MYKVQIQPHWQLTHAGGAPLPVHLTDLLAAIHATGSLAAAARQQGMSYRYAWGQLKQADQAFGQPLLRMHRGQGARLTALGERLLRAAHRIGARLGPTLDNLAMELEAELAHPISEEMTPLRIHAPHDFALETLSRSMAAAHLPLQLKYCPPDEALAALRAGRCDLAGLHLPGRELTPLLLAHYQDLIHPQHDHVLHLAMRRVGLLLAPGNPHGIRALQDVQRAGVRMLLRQPGSGTRRLLDAMLARRVIDPARIRTCATQEPTHAAIAATLASGFADVGFGLEPPARRYGLEFLPLAGEHYFFLCPEAALTNARVRALLGLLRSDELHTELNHLPGYVADDCGQIRRFDEVFADSRRDFPQIRRARTDCE